MFVYRYFKLKTAYFDISETLLWFCNFVFHCLGQYGYVWKVLNSGSSDMSGVLTQQINFFFGYRKLDTATKLVKSQVRNSLRLPADENYAWIIMT
jgi:hypothetical protein